MLLKALSEDLLGTNTAILLWNTCTWDYCSVHAGKNTLGVGYMLQKPWAVWLGSLIVLKPRGMQHISHEAIVQWSVQHSRVRLAPSPHVKSKGVRVRNMTGDPFVEVKEG